MIANEGVSFRYEQSDSKTLLKNQGYFSLII
jgi:hypothetical protein